MEPVYIKNEKLKRTYNEFIPNNDNSAFIFRIFKDKYIHDYRHIHAEYELIYIKKGSGTKNIGDLSLPCPNADVTLIGSAIPHYYHIDPLPGENEVEAWVIQFDKNFLGAGFFEFAENVALKNFINAANNGVEIKPDTCLRAIKLFHTLLNVPKNKRIILFLELLDMMASPGNYATMLNAYKADNLNDASAERLAKVTSYVTQQYANPITVKQMADLVHLSKSAFCNLFKKRFNCCFSEYLNEYRISKASKMLAETDMPVNEILTHSGFSNQSYFNRVFKKQFGTHPNQYRKMLSGSVIKHRVGVS
jgi:AraC-like DNA-binding protein